MKKLNKGMTFAEILKNDPKAAEALINEGMHCVGCPMSMYETLEQGAKAHGIDSNKLIKKLNKKKWTIPNQNI